MKLTPLLIIVLLVCNSVSAAEGDSPIVDTQTKDEARADKDGPSVELDDFGFGPAFFVIEYDEEVLSDANQVVLRGDGLIEASGSRFFSTIGLEVHYDFLFNERRYAYGEGKDKKWVRSDGWVVSPFLGVYDIDDGIKGSAAGVMVGYWKGDGKFGSKKSLNVGLGWTVHRDQLVLANGVNEKKSPPDGLTQAEYTTRKDVKGTIAMISVSFDF